MKRARMQAAAVGGSADDIEQAFYESLQRGDVQQLMACWADEDDIVCVLPGGARCIGAGAIRAAFEALFARGAIHATPQAVHRIDALASAVHHLIERVEVHTPKGPQTAWVTATNVYHKTAQGWRLVAHHASPGSPQDSQAGAAGPAVLH